MPRVFYTGGIYIRESYARSTYIKNILACAGNIYIENTYTRDNCSKDIYIRGIYIKVFYNKDIYWGC